jgi:Mn2+/Fe2+ NRAMP family transporter
MIDDHDTAPTVTDLTPDMQMRQLRNTRWMYWNLALTVLTALFTMVASQIFGGSHMSVNMLIDIDIVIGGVALALCVPLIVLLRRVQRAN